MTKREQIEELKNILLEESNRFYGLECDEACAYCEASAVYDAGYRKVSKNYIGTDKVLRSIDYRPVEEVRKETAKEIFREIFQTLAINYVDEEIGCQDECIDTACLYEDLMEIMKKYGVEVEE